MRLIDPATLAGRQRYQLMTSVVVPRPIGWISTWGVDRVANLAPYSYFAALSAAPMLVGVSIGERRSGLKDTLVNVREHRAFCVNVVSEHLLDAMNASSADVGPEVDEFSLVGLEAAKSDRVDAPYVDGCPAVLECEVMKEVDLGEAPNVLVIGEVVGVRLSDDLVFDDDTLSVSAESLKPVGRLSGGAYALPGAVRRIARPR